ncbi:MAG: phosphate ABC transporter substrate-binding protein PstS [Desulfobacterales bacterium]
MKHPQNQKLLKSRFLAVLLLLVCWPGLMYAGGSVSLVGGGATLPAPLYQNWFRAYNRAHPNVLIDYLPLGSGAGISQFLDQRLDFAGTDVPLSAAETAKVDGGVVQIPMTAGALVLIYNLKEVDHLKLTREAYTGIFLGTVSRWNDPLIADANLGAALPDTPIVLVTRSDASGTTYTLTRHLSAANSKFADTVGVAKAPVWPKSLKARGNLIRARGNGGVVNMVQAIPGAIGYVEYSYAYLTDIAIASLQNRAGQFVAPNQKTFQITLRDTTIRDDLTVVLTDPASHGNYPVVTFTWLLARQQSKNSEEQKAIKDLLRYCLTEGQQGSDKLGYIPLTGDVVSKSLQLIEQIH